eukprot:TRINITY_DN7559_c0_g1_i1.p1 TRINITY_DN7559_c0_g1~~TRINITY_DN7559_c0_g1_i1.p1  ORF type:complete len:1117 (-),score=266.57 TRINITY_DN7559_c0_g1_i1:148-3498(-)
MAFFAVRSSLSARLLKGAGATNAHFRFSAAVMVHSRPSSTQSGEQLKLVLVDYADLSEMNETALAKLREGYVGPKAFGAVGVINIPGYKEFRQKAFRAGIDLALKDEEGRKRAAAVNNTYPGWSGTPGQETHPLQSSFLFNTKEEINGVPEQYFGKNIFPSEQYQKSWNDLVRPMHESACQVLRGCDIIMEEEVAKRGLSWAGDGRSLEQLGRKGPALASRFICYDSGFTRADDLLDKKPEGAEPGEKIEALEADILDGLMESSEPSAAKTVGHAADGMASMRTHSTPVKSAGHAGDGMASMRTHSTPVKSAGHAGDGMASMRTHSTPVKSAGHAGDGMASMRTHSTPVKSAGHAGDGMASMRTHSTPLKSAGHAGDGMASMRTHSTPVKTSGTASDGSMGNFKMSTPALSGNATRTTTSTVSSSQAMQASTSAAPTPTEESLPPLPSVSASSEASTEAQESAFGDYWLPWHIDSNFMTIIHKEMYVYESDASPAPEPKNSGVVMMNKDGDVIKVEAPEDTMVMQGGGFGQIYSGGVITGCRHAVINERPPGIARFNFCNFWYVNWDTPCTVLPGYENEAVSKGWNAMMDDSYLNISQKDGFAAFRTFMTSPEARLQFQDSVHFKELSELLPLPSTRAVPLKSGVSNDLAIDLLTDVRCPFSYLAILHVKQAIKNLGLEDRVYMRYHPIFLNPNVAPEGESLDDYLLREHGISKQEAHSEDYFLYQQGLKAGVKLNPNRRVVNTFDAFCAIQLAEKEGLQDDLLEELSRRYFEQAQDLSDAQVLKQAAVAVGMTDAEKIPEAIADAGLRAGVWNKYQTLSEQVGEVPLFLFRERYSANGVEMIGQRSVEDWERVLQSVVEKGQLMGMEMPTVNGQTTWVPEGNPTSPVSHCTPAQHGFAADQWPYQPSDFIRQDETEDNLLYATPRIGVVHLDESSLQNLTSLYSALFDKAPAGFSVLDMCSSWTSHFPETLEASRVVLHGINAEELQANSLATERHVQDLNKNPALSWAANNSFEFVTNACSVQYLTKPKEVFTEIHRVLKPGGCAVFAFSHRSFIQKAVNCWAREPNDGEGHALAVRNYFMCSVPGGWSHVKSIDVSPRHGDPVWAVVAVKADN